MVEDAFFIQHDLVHYAVETTCACREAFYGLLARGWDISSFGVADPATGAKPAIPLEAGQVEMVVGAFQRELAGAIDPADFQAGLELSCTAAGISYPAFLAGGQIDEVRHAIPRLFAAWKTLPVGETLELRFN
jgi:hypothetical protein